MTAVNGTPSRAALLLGCLIAGGVGCATTAPPITKLVNGRIVLTRAVSPEAYEHVTRALLYEEEERWQEAADELQRALPFDPDAAEVRAELAELFVRLGRLDDAAEEVARSLETGPSVEGYLAEAHLAEAQVDQARRARAIPALREAANLALEGDDPEAVERAHLELADAEVVALDLPAAIDTLRRLVHADPATLRGRVQLATLSWPLGSFDEARRAATEALELEPNDVEARILLGELEIATGRIDAAKAAFRAAIDRADAPLEIADAYAGWLTLRGDKAEAEELADRLTADAGNPDSLALASGLECTVKRPARALALADRAQKLGAGAGRTALLVGAALAAKDDPPGAIKSYLGVAKTDPAYFESRLRAADLLREAGKLDEADRALDEAAAASNDTDHAVVLAIARSRVDEKRGDAARAGRRLDEALSKNADDARLLLARAAVDERRGDWQRALTRTDALLARQPRNVEALNFAGFVAVDHAAAPEAHAAAPEAHAAAPEAHAAAPEAHAVTTEAHAVATGARAAAPADLGRAMRRLQAAVALSPGSGGIVDSLGWAYFRTGDLAHADLFLEQAGRLEPGDPEILGHLGDLYARRLERDRALSTYRRALDLKPTDRVARELGERIRTLEAKSAAGR
jgi:tetratricopeptide (TPR) repeat protein